MAAVKVVGDFKQRLEAELDGSDSLSLSYWDALDMLQDPLGGNPSLLDVPGLLCVDTQLHERAIYDHTYSQALIPLSLVEVHPQLLFINSLAGFCLVLSTFVAVLP